VSKINGGFGTMLLIWRNIRAKPNSSYQFSFYFLVQSTCIDSVLYPISPFPTSPLTSLLHHPYIILHISSYTIYLSPRLSSSPLSQIVCLYITSSSFVTMLQQCLLLTFLHDIRVCVSPYTHHRKTHLYTHSHLVLYKMLTRFENASIIWEVWSVSLLEADVKFTRYYYTLLIE